jgi:hypothetical protein
MVTFHGVFPALLFFHLNLHEVVLRACPSYNPRGTCPRWADTPAALGWAKPRSRQFQALVEKEECFEETRTRTRKCMVFFSLLGVFLAPLFFHLDLHEVVQRARLSYNPRGTCPRWADTPAAPGWAKPQSRQFQALVEKEMFGEMFEERHSHLLKCLCPIAWAWLHVVAGCGRPVKGVVAVAVAVAVAVTIGLLPLAMLSRIMMSSRRRGKSSRNFSFRRGETSRWRWRLL